MKLNALNSSLQVVRPLSLRVLQTSHSGKMAFCSWFKEEHYRDHFEPGIYVCAECDHKLFSSRSKFQHDAPWPSFTHTITEQSVKKVPEENRPNALKLLCGKCDIGLGHEFLKDGPDEKSRF